MVKISVIIATLDRGEDLIALLNQLAEEKKLEVIVVDQTEKHADEHQQKLNGLFKNNNNFHNYRLDLKNVSNARNFGVQKSSGNYLLFIDDDVTLPDGYITRFANFAGENQNIDAVAGMVLGLDLSINYTLSKEFYNKQYGRMFKPLNYGYKLTDSDLPSGNLLIKKTVFQSLQGYDTNLLRFEDSDFAMRFFKAGFKSCYEPELYLIHKATPTGSARKSIDLNKSDVYWEQCFYLILKNFGLYKGRGLLWYYLRRRVINRPTLKKPAQFAIAISKVYAGYFLARNKIKYNHL